LIVKLIYLTLISETSVLGSLDVQTPRFFEAGETVFIMLLYESIEDCKLHPRFPVS